MNISAFEILGPIMVGPSSSHTAGALRIALVARSLGPEHLARVDFTLYNSFAKTYRGHGTDRALVAGMLGFAPDDERVRDSFAQATNTRLIFSFAPASDEEGAGRHPNTVTCVMTGVDGNTVSVTGESLGGGRIRISQVDGVNVELSGDYPTLFISHRDHPGVLAALTGTLATAGANIATINTFRKERGGMAYTIIELDESASTKELEGLRKLPKVISACVVEIPGATLISADAEITLDYNNGHELLKLCQNKKLSIGALTRAREIELSSGDAKAVDAQMERVLTAMRGQTTDPINNPRPSLGGLIGGQARAVFDNADKFAAPLMGNTLTRASAYAMATLERSASMGVIVAAPTAGSSGVVPGAVLAVSEAIGADDQQIKEALWCAAGIGAIMTRNATVAGAEGGCQAEVGSAAAMAAAAVAQLLGATPSVALSAASTAIDNLLGLVCDPVRGLVEHPCQDRNVIGVSAALSSAQLALSGVLDPLPFDEVVEAMRQVGAALPATLRETALGGLAATPSAHSARSRCSICGLCD